MQSIRGRLTDRLEQALGQLGDSNARYASLLTSYEHNREELKRAEKESQLMREKMIQKDNCLSQLQTEIDERETRVITWPTAIMIFVFVQSKTRFLLVT